MNTRPLTRTIGRAALAAAWLAAALASPAADPAGTLAAATGVPATVTANKVERKVLLLRIEGPNLFLRPPDAPEGVAIAVSIASVEKVRFTIDYDRGSVFRSVRARAWNDAAGTLVAAIRSAVPFIELPDNNALDPALEAARCFRMHALQLRRQGAASEDAAKKAYTAALYIYDLAARAAWAPEAETSRMRAILCRLELDRTDEAAEALDAARVPEIGDAAYGLYWAAKASLALRRQEYRDAANHAVRAVVFDNKDGWLFPEALFLSARCYEELLEVHRARDVFYELARLFPGTEWGDMAVARLTALMKSGSTRQPEKANIAKVFFGTEEDMNAIVDKFLAARAPAPRGTGGAATPVSVMTNSAAPAASAPRSAR